MKILKLLLFIISMWKIFTSEIMKLLLRIAGAKIGKNVFISVSARFLCNKIEIGNDSRILEKVRIKANEFKCGKSVVISNDSLFSGSDNLIIGDKSYFGKNSRIDLSRDVKIGKDVGFGENSIIWTHGYFPPADEGYPVTYAPVSIDDGAWVSTSIIVLPGVNIGKGVIVGAGSVITRSVQREQIIAGNPAKVIKDVKSIIKEVNFKTILQEILDKFKNEVLLNKIQYGNYVKYEYSKFNILLVDGCEVDLDTNKKNIVLAKNITEVFLKKIYNHYWFDFDTKIRKRTKYKEVEDLHFHFKGFGIRFLIED